MRRRRLAPGTRVSVMPFANADDAGRRVRGSVVEVRGGCIIMVDEDGGGRRWFPFGGLRVLKRKRRVS